MSDKRNWKSPPSDPAKQWIGKSLELQILLACPWDCHACDALSNFHSISFNRKGTMTLDQIQHFVTQMQTANAYLGRVRILGGEPTLHPKLVEIVTLLHDELILKGHVGFLELITNGDHPDKIEPIKHMIHRVRVSGESDKQKHHVANLTATPEARGYKGIRCNHPTYCGASLNRWGYFACSPGAALARLNDQMEGNQRLELPIVGGPDANWSNIQSLCDKCLYGLREEDKVKCGTGQQPGQHELNTPSPEVWAKLSPWLAGKQPEWKVYGDDATTATPKGINPCPNT